MFLVADDELSTEGVIIGRSVLEHMKIDTHTLLEINRSALDSVGCSGVGNPTSMAKGGYVSMVMNARADNVREYRRRYYDKQQQSVNDFKSQYEYDTLQYPNLHDVADLQKKDEVSQAIDSMIENGEKNGLKLLS